MAEIVTIAKSTQDPGAGVFFGRNDEVGMAGTDLGEGRAFVEASIQEEEISFLEVLDELFDEFVLRGACLVVDEVQWCAGDQIKEAAKLDGDCSEALLPVVCAESFPERLRLGQSESGLVSGEQVQPVPTTAVFLGGRLQP